MKNAKKERMKNQCVNALFLLSEAKQSRTASDALDCVVACAPRNDGKIQLSLNLIAN
jgi:hypothetical protein